MALIFRGSSVCSLCGKVLQQDEDVYGFPAFGENPKDPLHRFSDAAFHEACLLADAAGRRAVALIEDRASRIGPGNRKCAVCGEEVLDWNDYGMIDYICSPELHPVSSFNYTHFHKSHSTLWPRKDELIRELGSAWKAGIISVETAKDILDHIGLTVPADW